MASDIPDQTQEKRCRVGDPRAAFGGGKEAANGIRRWNLDWPVNGGSERMRSGGIRRWNLGWVRSLGDDISMDPAGYVAVEGMGAVMSA